MTQFFKNSYPNYFYTEDGTRLFYSTNFSKENFDPKRPTLVFIYGLLCNNGHFREQLPFFDELGYQILIHDYRYHYSSSQDGDIKNCSFDQISTDLYEMLNFLEIKKAHLISHSMGVNIALEFSKKYPTIVKTQTLISGTIVAPQDIMFDTNLVDIFSPLLKTLSEKFPNAFENIWKTSYMNPLARFIIFDGGFNTQKTSTEFVELYMKKISELPKELFFHLLEQMRDHDVINYLETIKANTLIIGGDKDKVIPNYLQQILHKKLPKSELYIVKDGSHVPQVDFPDLINKRIHRFLIKN